MNEVKVERETLAKTIVEMERFITAYRNIVKIDEASDTNKTIVTILNNCNDLKKQMGEISTGIDETKWKQIKLF
jgi:hypothetical protein